MIVYISELFPSKTDLRHYVAEIKAGMADIVPSSGSDDYYALTRWDGGDDLPPFSDSFRLQRAIRIVDVSKDAVDEALTRIDDTITSIEQSAFDEYQHGNIPNHWIACGEARDCVACDFRHYCPSVARRDDQSQRSPGKAPLGPSKD